MGIMDSGGPMGQDDSGFFAAEIQKEAGRVINVQDAKINALLDRVYSLEDRLAKAKTEAFNWEMKYLREHAIRTKKRSWLDWIIGYIG
jgi:hypothetical protein